MLCGCDDQVWNAPTWFLSALSYATVVLRFALPYLAKQSKHQLRRLAPGVAVSDVELKSLEALKRGAV